MLFFYNLSILFYQLVIYLVSPFNSKAKQWISGRKDIFKKLESTFIDNTTDIIWFHAASLGEFEQGRPVIEAYRHKFSNCKILITFFSPSGYEIRKKYEKADWVFYLPLDTRRNAKKFLAITKPKKVVFIKYEFWFHYLNELQKQDIPTYFISAIFRKNQIFFKWYGKWYKKQLINAKKIFVQNEASYQLLESNNFQNAEISGDTRFDRVYEVAKNPTKLPLIESTLNTELPTIIAGSSWQTDEEYLARFIKENNNINLIIAPHEIHKHNLMRIEKLFDKSITRYCAIEKDQKTNIILIDQIGILSSLYQYGDIAIIGGGFGKGIHNILEAATFGLPVLFGPNYDKFNEAKELIKLNGAFSYANYTDLETFLKHLLNNKEMLDELSKIVKTFIDNNIGATNKIIDELTIS